MVGAGVGEVANGVVGVPNGLKPGGGFSGLVLGVIASEVSEALSLTVRRGVVGERGMFMFVFAGMSCAWPAKSCWWKT